MSDGDYKAQQYEDELAFEHETTAQHARARDLWTRSSSDGDANHAAIGVSSPS